MNKTILITGGAGFIGIHSAAHFASNGWDVWILDNFSRRGTESNLEWLSRQHKVNVFRCDIRNAEKVASIVLQVRPNVVLHLAAQVAVTTSVKDPREDFEINALGTFNVLDAIRLHSADSFVIYSSTNKVYGQMESLGIELRNGRWEYANMPNGVTENMPLDFHSPYGCSKGCADQYVIDFSRIYGLRAVTLRQSCIYGTRQFGIEDQGWVAWFSIAATLGKPITIYGDGRQIRDVLNVSDLTRAFECAIQRQELISGNALNIGGGPVNTLSLLELIEMLKQMLGTEPEVRFADWRPGDQKVFVSNIERARNLLGWSPEITVKKGLQELIEWTCTHRDLFSHL